MTVDDKWRALLDDSMCSILDLIVNREAYCYRGDPSSAIEKCWKHCYYYAQGLEDALNVTNGAFTKSVGHCVQEVERLMRAAGI